MNGEIPYHNHKKEKENKLMRQEWKELVDVEKKYSMDEAIEKYNEVMEFLRSKKIRIIMTAQGKRQPLENEVHLSDEDKRKYTFKYLMLNYTKESCEKIIKGIDTIYHFYDITSEEAVEVFEYSRIKGVTISEAVQTKLGGMGLEELAEFTSEVYMKIKEILNHTLVNTTADKMKEALFTYSMGKMIADAFSKEDEE